MQLITFVQYMFQVKGGELNVTSDSYSTCPREWMKNLWTNRLQGLKRSGSKSLRVELSLGLNVGRLNVKAPDV